MAQGVVSPYAERLRTLTRLERNLAIAACAIGAVLPVPIELVSGRDGALGVAAVLPVLLAAIFFERRTAAAITAVAVVGSLVPIQGTVSVGSSVSDAVTYVAVAWLGVLLGRERGGPRSTAPELTIVPVEATTQVSAAVSAPLDELGGGGLAVRVIEVHGRAILDEEHFSRRASVLSRRQAEVVRLAIAGLTAREIGRLLFISERTVETHLANAYERLGVHSRGELVSQFSVRRGAGYGYSELAAEA